MIEKFIFSILLFLPLLSSAESAAIENCRDIKNSQQIFACSKIEREEADEKLNSTYKKLLSRVQVQYKASPELYNQLIQNIKESQRLWIKLRDSDCNLEAFQIERGSQAYETTINNCVARLSYARSEYLERSVSPDIY